MRLFLSYAHIDKSRAIQIVELLSIHEVWFDNRLSTGQEWWKEIQRRLEWCDGFIFLLSPDSMNSEYVLKEFAFAYKMGKAIFPVLLREETPIPALLADMPYVDMTNGVNTVTSMELLNAIFTIEQTQQKSLENNAQGKSESVIAQVANAMESGNFEQAITLLKQAKANGFTSRFIKLDVLVQEAEKALARQLYVRQAEYEYRAIQRLMRIDRYRKPGIDAFRIFQEFFPDYDPDNLISLLHGQGINRNYKHHIFLSYSHKDTQLIRDVCVDLKNGGFIVWIDDGIEPGTPLWDAAIEDALENTGCMIVILTPNAKQSKGVRDEIHYATMHKIRIFPILALGDESNAIPYILSGTQWVDIRNDYHSGIKKIVSAIGKHLSLS